MQHKNRQHLRVLVGMPSTDSWGGPIFCEPPFVAAVRAAGVEVDEEVYVYGDKKTATPVFERARRVADAARRLRRRTKTKRYDVIHLNTTIDEKSVLRDTYTLTLLRSSQAKIYLKMHGSSAKFLATRNPVWRFLMRRLFARVDCVGVLSAEEHENFLRAGCAPEKLVTTKYVIEADKFKSDESFLAQHGIASDTPMLLFSARFIAAKGLLDLIHAIAIVRDAGHKFVLCCLGDGSLRAEAEREVRRLQLENCVRFFGYIPETGTTAFHANSSMFILPTYHDEGFPLVILKSLAAGVPIITARIRAAADYMHEPENCLWTEARNPSQLAEKIIRLLRDKNLRAAMSQNNRALAEQFAPAHVAREYIEICEKMMREQ